MGAIGWACFLVALCWICTRPWASLLLATISLGAHVAASIASPVFVLIWALTSGFFCYWYLTWIPESQPGFSPGRGWTGNDIGSPGPEASPHLSREKEGWSSAFV